MWSRNVSDVENMDIICFGHLLFEMCAGYELNSPQPTSSHYELDLDKYPQVCLTCEYWERKAKANIQFKINGKIISIHFHFKLGY